jgi:hypothetical protein
MLVDLQKYKLYKALIAEAEKTARFIEFVEVAAPDDPEQLRRIDHALLRYYALQRRIEKIRNKYIQEAAED